MACERVITLGVPVYRGEDYLAESLASIRSQTHQEFQVLISLDGPDPAAEEVCAPFLTDPRFRLSVRPHRLGWVGNIDWLMRQVRTPYWCYQQQDDLIDPRYLELLVDHLDRHPEAAVAYSDARAFGEHSWAFVQPSVTGSSVGRQLALLADHVPAVAFRGVTRVEALREMGEMPTNGVENFASEVTWMAAVARSGELHRVPGELYRKRYHRDNVHTKWAHWPVDKRRRAWLEHCADMLAQAVTVEAMPEERRLLWLAAVARLVSPRLGGVYLASEELTRTARAALVADFLAHVRDVRCPRLPELLATNWWDLEQWTEDFCRVPGPPTLAERQRRVLAEGGRLARGARRRLRALRPGT